MNRRVLVTGASGFLGRHIVEELRRFTNLEISTTTHAEVDLCDEQAVTDLFAGNSVDVLVHMAGRPRLGESPAAVATQWRDTFTVGRNVLTAAAQSGVSHILAVGSMTEMGNLSGHVSPDRLPTPIETYGVCKQLLLELSQYLVRTRQLRIDWFRPTTVYGPGQRGPMLIPSAFAAALGIEDGSFTAGTQQRDFIYVGDVARWVSMAADAGELLPPAQLQVHHLGTSMPERVSGVLDLIEELCGATLNRGSAPRRPGEPEMQSVPPYWDQPGKIVDWKPEVDLRAGLELTRAWWLENARLD